VTDERLDAIADHLAATAELPVRPAASRCLGEAEAVAADVAGADLPDAVVHERVGRVGDLLAAVDGTGHAEADEHVEAARELVDDVLDD
jgi:hypothetical protein